MKDEIIAQHQNEKPENLWIDEQNELRELTAEQEDFMLEECMERERELKNPTSLTETPTSFELTIQKLKERRVREGWSAEQYFNEMEKEASFELEEYKRELNLAYGVD